MLKVNRTRARKRCEICSRLAIKTPERRQLRCSDVFIFNFEHISSFAIVDFEQEHVWWSIEKHEKFTKTVLFSEN